MPRTIEQFLHPPRRCAQSPTPASTPSLTAMRGSAGVNPHVWCSVTDVLNLFTLQTMCAHPGTIPMSACVHAPYLNKSRFRDLDLNAPGASFRSRQSDHRGWGRAAHFRRSSWDFLPSSSLVLTRRSLQWRSDPHRPPHAFALALLTFIASHRTHTHTASRLAGTHPLLARGPRTEGTHPISC